MKRTGKLFAIALSSGAMLALILDSKTAMQAAVQGIELCMRTVVPSLFPMMILSSILTQWFCGNNMFLRPIEKLCGIPYGAGGIYLTGLLGGYPIGAKCTAEAYRNQTLSLNEANRMFSFCSNAGPAFLFGICAPLFSSAVAVWFLWLVQVISSLITGAMLRNKSQRSITVKQSKRRSITEIVSDGTRAIAVICSWIILFRVLILFVQKWFLWLLPNALQVIISGLLELTNGCCMLSQIPEESLRFVICSALIGFGGMCVTMQTLFLTKGLQPSAYLKGKTIQFLVNLLLSTTIAGILFPHGTNSNLLLCFIVLTIFIVFILLIKIIVDFRINMLYNAGIKNKKGSCHAVPKKN